MLKLILATALVIPLAACGKSGDGTTVSITADNGSAGIANGTATIDVPGFKGKISLPPIQLGAGSIDLDGAKLYPGSTVRSVNVNAHDGEKAEDKVNIVFDAPGTVDAVRTHFRTELTKADFTVADDGTGLAGKTKDGKHFTLALSGTGNTSRGELAVGH